MASADFLRFVVTAHFFTMRPQDLPGYSHILSLFACRIYRKRFRAAIGLHFIVETCPRLWPYMRFLFVRPEFCPLGDLSTPKIRLSSDSTSRWTPLPLASPSRYRADSGLSPYRTCAHRAHINVEEDRSVLLHFLAALHNSARAFGEGFFVETRFEKCRNTLCTRKGHAASVRRQSRQRLRNISRFSNR